jgi:hypothetical protein
MDCKTARLLLDFARPRPAELAGDDAAALEGHLHACPDCDALARGERQFDDHLGRAVRAVPVPEGLRDRLLTRLATEQRNRSRRRLVPVAALAATLLLGVVGYFIWPRHQLPTPNPEQIALDVSEQHFQGQNAEQVRAWFLNRRGVDAEAPSDIPGEGKLDYSLLTYYDVAPCQGQQVPMLLFVKGTMQARIYILPNRQFNLADDQDDKDSELKVLYRPLPGRRFVYVIVLSGIKTLTPFLSSQSPPAA